MNILLSAYACEPNKGSEPGVGWSWAIELAKHHSVWVLTRDNNESTINKYLQENPTYKNTNLHFVYVGLSPNLTFWKKGRRGMRLFYMMWQYKATKVAQELHKNINFDLVQHVTFVSYTQPSYMYKLGIPMIWGPISGGENIPNVIKLKMSIREKSIEFFRKLSQKFALILPSIRMTMKKSEYIFVATEETKDKIPIKYRNKVKVISAIGLEFIPKLNNKNKNKSHKVKIIMAGRLIYWKAFDIGIKAYLNIVEKYPNTELHILGQGDKKNSLEVLAGRYLNKNIFFQNPISHDEIFDFYYQYDIFMNTSLRDSGCMTMMEALSVGLPCVTISCGGPKKMANKYMKVEPDENEIVINNLANKLEILIDNINNSSVIEQYKIDIESLTMKSKINNIKTIYNELYSIKNR